MVIWLTVYFLIDENDIQWPETSIDKLIRQKQNGLFIWWHYCVRAQVVGIPNRQLNNAKRTEIVNIVSDGIASVPLQSQSSTVFPMINIFPCTHERVAIVVGGAGAVTDRSSISQRLQKKPNNCINIRGNGLIPRACISVPMQTYRRANMCTRTV